MSAGSAALETANRLRRATRRLQLRARRTADLAERYETGAAGEVVLAELLEELLPYGWHLLHDCALGAGNIDSLAIGPSGVAVIDAKNWSGDLVVEQDLLRQDGHPRPKVLAGINRQVAAVEEALEEAGLDVSVAGFVALTSAGHRDEPLQGFGEHLIGGAMSVVSYLRSSSTGPLVGQRFGIVHRYLAERFPQSGQLERGSVPSALRVLEQERSFFGLGEDAQWRTWYLRSWRRYGHHRLYLRANGEELGWKDVPTGAVTLTCEGLDAPLAKAVLDSATPFGVRLPADEMPSVPVDLLGSRVAGRSRIYVGLLIGQEWRKGEHRRLYGRLIDRAEGHFDLGYVDLRTGEARPSIDGRLNGRLRSAEHYLERLSASYREP